MSFVHVLLVHNHRVWSLHVHYRTAQRLLEQGPDGFVKSLPGRCRDAGYLVLDFDNRLVVNCQDAFVVKPVRKWNVLDV